MTKNKNQNKYKVVSEYAAAIHPAQVIKLAQNGYTYVRSLPEYQILVFSQRRLSTRQALQRGNKYLSNFNFLEEFRLQP